MTFVDDHGNAISEYEAQRLERIAKNEAYLKSLGLDTLKSTMRQTKNTTKKKKPKTNNAPVVPQRQSKRLCKSSDEKALVMLSYADEDDTRCIPQGESPSNSDDDEDTFEVSAKPFRGRKYRIHRDAWELSQAEKETLQQRINDNYLSKFKEFLVFHNKISEQNVRNVMKQVSKLARGEGVRYESPQYGWPPNCYFSRGNPITPLSDIPTLMEQAQECEDKWGRDRGNGWLLSHPLKKLLLFQQFALLNPDFLTSKCKLKEYYDAHETEEEEEEEEGEENSESRKEETDKENNVTAPTTSGKNKARKRKK